MKQGINANSPDLKYKGNTTKPGNPLWDEYMDSTGQSTLEIHTKRKISEWDTCKHKKWDILDGNGNIRCNSCGLGRRIVWGIHKVTKAGKLVKV